MKLQTTVDIAPSKWQIGYEDSILMLGSCFSDEIGEQMKQRYLNVTCNPFGTLYNPLSIANALNMHEVPELVEHEGLWHSMAHHGSFSRSDKKEEEEAVRASIETMQRALKEATVVIVTFGTAWIYEMNGAIVGNCHKLPEQCFTRRRLTVEEIVALWQPLLQELAAYYSGLKVLFTVSPIRHMADGAHGNQLSKSTLLLAIDNLLPTIHCPLPTYYFPSYEIVLDELRDYRFFDEKMTHPTPLAVDIVWDRFQRATMLPAIREQAHFNAKQHKREKHIPLH